MTFLYVSLGNSFPYLKDYVASISVYDNQMNYAFGKAGAMEGPARGVLAWLSKQTYQEQVQTGCHQCHIHPRLKPA